MYLKHIYGVHHIFDDGLWGEIRCSDGDKLFIITRVTGVDLMFFFVTVVVLAYVV